MTIATLSNGQADLPSSESTASYWHREPSEKLLGHRTTADLPAEADVVVIGSGITGAFAARELVAGGRSVLMLEAREACWGATGRNGGHCQPLVYASRPHLARFEVGTFEFLLDLVAQNEIPCDWRTVGGVHRIETQEVADLTATWLEALRQRHPELAALARLVTDRQELEALRLTGEVVAAVVQPYAARLWPYKLVAWVLERLLEEEGYNLQTGTPVTHLQRVPGSTPTSGSDSASWILHTPRGQVAARQVLLATNGYTSHLLPRMARVIVPVRGQVCALRPPAGSRPLDHSHAWVSSGLSDDYLIQAADDADGPVLILGGERMAAPGGDVGVSRDDEVVEEVGRRLRHALHDAVTLTGTSTGAGTEAGEPDELRATHEWTGIMGYTPDQHPWVGPVIPAMLDGASHDGDDNGDEETGSSSNGLWICAGYTGHGMPTAARCAVAVVDMMLGREATVDLPDEFRVRRARLEEAIKTSDGLGEGSNQRSLLEDSARDAVQQGAMSRAE